MKRSNWHELSVCEQSLLLKRPAMDNKNNIDDVVTKIINDVRENGDDAVRKYTQKFDQCDVDILQVSQDEMQEALTIIDDDKKQAIDTAYKNIYAFHKNQGYQAYQSEVNKGVKCERRVVPINAVGLYVPGGTAPLVSTTLMNGIPSQIAQCPIRILCTPCNKEGKVNPYILYAAKLCGIDKIFKVGGAQAIASMAFGTQTIPSVSKIFGPGNAYVTAAKKLVSMDVDGAALDMPAGPSEICVIADELSNPAFVAADLLSQAEHDVYSQVLLISPSSDLIESVHGEIEKQLASLSRKDIAAEAIKNSNYIQCKDIDEAVKISNRYAPEHLILNCENPDSLVDKITNAGSIFIGAWTPESAGDYCSGTNHVLPTYGYAKSYSGLNVEAFQKTITVQGLTQQGLKSLGKTIQDLADLEGLDAHANAVSIRLKEMR